MSRILKHKDTTYDFISARAGQVSSPTIEWKQNYIGAPGTGRQQLMRAFSMKECHSTNRLRPGNLTEENWLSSREEGKEEQILLHEQDDGCDDYDDSERKPEEMAWYLRIRYLPVLCFRLLFALISEEKRCNLSLRCYQGNLRNRRYFCDYYISSICFSCSYRKNIYLLYIA